MLETITAAAPTAGGPGAGTLILGGLTLTVLYLTHCSWRPWTACSRCDGNPRFRSSSGKTWRDCPRCKGSGRRVRFGARMLRGRRGSGK